ncbi:MAG: peptidylprolyl isomerase [Nanoarchaeota archaeon]|nr:peptidylprolyl isomerase [Nanoarchaeota archaeon]
MEKIPKSDFIEIEFTGKVKDGNIFDSNIKKDLEKAGINAEAKPFVFCLGKGMFLKGIEEFLADKEMGKEYSIELPPEKAFGDRNSSLIKVIPIGIFIQQKINPQPGTMFNFDGQIAKVISVSGGRVITDFNNPIAGKTVEYKVKVLREVTDLEEKTKSLFDFFFRRQFQFEIKDQKLVINVERQFAPLLVLFKDKFKELLGLDLEVREIKQEDKETSREPAEKK